MSDGNGSGNLTPVTGRYEHPGHDRIAREVFDLRQRENELRDRWKGMGFELPQVCSDKETPFTLPDPIPDDVVTRRPSHIDVLPSCPRDSTDGSGAFETLSVSSEASTSSSSTAAMAAAMTTPSNFSSVSDRYSSIKVRPYEDPDETNESERRPPWAAFSPLNETPIQREIRLSAEREQSLRQMRGLQPAEVNTSADGDRRQVSPIDNGSEGDSADEVILRDDQSPKSNAGRLSLRNFASARLQLEIEREKQRELDLLRLGCIRTTSIDHMASLTAEGVHENDTRNHADHKTNGSAANQGSYVETISSRIELQSQQQQQQQQAEMSWDAQRRHSRGSEKDGGVTCIRSNGPTTKRWSASLVGSSQRDADDCGRIQLRHSTTSELIERELQELELRERELRMQRADSSTHSTPSNGYASGIDTHERLNGATSPIGNDVTRPRNRLSGALIGQWEDRACRQ